MRRLVVVAGAAGLCMLAAGDRAGREAIGAAVPAFVTIAALLALGVARFSALGALTTVPALVLAYLGLRGLRV